MTILSRGQGQTDRPTDIANYRAAITAKKLLGTILTGDFNWDRNTENCQKIELQAAVPQENLIFWSKCQ